MTDDLIDRAKAALEGVTPGEWTAKEFEYRGYKTLEIKSIRGTRPLGCVFDIGQDLSQNAERQIANARFIAAARQLVPDLIAAIEARDARIAGLEAAFARIDEAVEAGILAAAEIVEAAEARVKVLEEALLRIAQASDHYANEREAENRGAETLAYAHSSTCRLARAALEGEKTEPLPRVRHLKRGGTYEVVGRAKVQTDAPLTDYDEVVVYQSEHDRTLWVRPVSEFEDGRFVSIKGEK